MDTTETTQAGRTLELPSLGVRIDIRRTTAELLEFDVVGRARGFKAQAHVHPGQSERHDVIEGAMRPEDRRPHSRPAPGRRV